MTNHNAAQLPSIWTEVLSKTDQGDYSGALFLLKRLAHDQFEPAFAQIARMYEFGDENNTPDLSLAVDWYKRSIERVDDVYSHLALARIYMQSENPDQYSNLIRYHLELLESNDVRGALYALGLAHEKGLAYAQSHEKALHYYERASSLGHLGAEVRRLTILQRQRRFRYLLPLLKARYTFTRALVKDRSDPRVWIAA